MAILIDIYANTKPLNSITVPYSSGTLSVTGLLKEETSVYKPTFIINIPKAGNLFSNIAKCNYAYVGDFGRYYWITDVRSVTANVSEIDCETDVLATFAAEILESEAEILYSSIREKGKVNPMLFDKRIPISIEHETVRSAGVAIPGVAAGGAGCYVVTAASSDCPTPVPAFVLSPDEIGNFLSQFYKTDSLSKVKDELYNPSDAVGGIVFLPCPKDKISGGTASLAYGDIDMGSYSTAKAKFEESFSIPITLPYRDAILGYDWRNIEPATQWAIELPGVGMANLPMSQLHTNADTQPTLDITMTVAVTTGEVVYSISSNGGRPVLELRGCFGVSVPFPKISAYGASALSQTASGVLGIGSGLVVGTAIATGLATGGLLPMIGAGVSALGGLVSLGNAANKSQAFQAGMGGSLGGWSTPSHYVDTCNVYYTTFLPSDEPTNMRQNVGYPVFKTAPLSDYANERVWCCGIKWKFSRTAVMPYKQEWQELERLMTSGDGVWLIERGELP